MYDFFYSMYLYYIDAYKNTFKLFFFSEFDQFIKRIKETRKKKLNKRLK